MNRTLYFLCLLLSIIIITSKKNWAQNTPPAGTPCITITVTKNATIQLVLKTSAKNTSIWIETTPSSYTEIKVGSYWIYNNCTVEGTTLKVYGDLSGFNCSDNKTKLTGLSFTYDMQNLTELYCFNNQLTSLDISNLTNLTRLTCNSNQLTNLDISALTTLIDLDCGENQLTNLNISTLTNLKELYCGENLLTNLDIANLTKLTELICFNNKITSLDISNLTNLTKFYCFKNKLKSLDISDLISLTDLDCSYNQLTQLNVANSNNSNLTTFYATNNQALTCIKVDDGFTPPTTWEKDSTAEWNNDNSNLCGRHTINCKN